MNKAIVGLLRDVLLFCSVMTFIVLCSSACCYKAIHIVTSSIPVRTPVLYTACLLPQTYFHPVALFDHNTAIEQLMVRVIVRIEVGLGLG